MPDIQKALAELKPAPNGLSLGTLFVHLDCEAPLTPVRNPNLLTVKNFIAEKMRHHDAIKYSPPTHEYEHFQHGNHQVVHVAQYPGTPDEEMLLKREENAVAVRELSILNGLLNAIPDGILGELSEKQKNTLIRELYKIATEIPNTAESSGEESKARIKRFTSHLVSHVARITGKDPETLGKSIMKAEQYYVAEYEQQKILYYEPSPGITIIDVPITQLTDKQKEQYQSIYSDNKPSWWIALEDWEKKWLTDRIPHPDAPSADQQEAWDAFEKLFMPTTMTHLPGTHNARFSYLYYNGELLSCTIKTASLVPINIKDKEERIEITKANNEQILEAAKKLRGADTRLMVNTLVTPIVKEDALVMEGQEIATMQLNDDKSNPRDWDETNWDKDKIVTLNTPVNKLRQIPLIPNEFWSAETECFYQYAANQSREKKLTPIAEDAFKQLTALRDMYFPRLFRERNLDSMKAAYIAIVVEKMGMMPSFNCKSGKDRTGQLEIEHHAMLIYEQIYKKLPKPDDTGDDRKNYVNIYCDLYTSMKIQESAGLSSPGSFGIKDRFLKIGFIDIDESMLSHDIAQQLRETYKLSNKLAEGNKPGFHAYTAKNDYVCMEIPYGDKKSIDSIISRHNAYGNGELQGTPRNLIDAPENHAAIVNKTTLQGSDGAIEFSSLHIKNDDSKIQSLFLYSPVEMRNAKQTEIFRIAAMEVEAFRLRCSSSEPVLRLAGKKMDYQLATAIEAYCKEQNYELINDTGHSPSLNIRAEMKNFIHSPDARALDIPLHEEKLPEPPKDDFPDHPLHNTPPPTIKI